MKLAHPILRWLLVMLASAALQVQAQTAVKSEHLDTVKRMMRSMSMSELVLEGARNSIEANRATNPDRAEALSKWLDNMTPEAITDRIAPIYAKHVSQADAEALARFFHSATGRKFFALIRESAGSNGIPPHLAARLTAAERAAIANFERGRAMQNFNMARPALTAEVKRELGEWWQSLGAPTTAPAYAQRLAAILESQLNEGQPGNSISRSEANRPTDPASDYMEKFISLAEESGNRVTQSRNTYSAKLEQLDLPSLLVPENLVSKDRLRTGQEVLGRFEDLLEVQLATINREHEDLHRKVKALEGPSAVRAEALAGFERGLAKNLDWYIRFGENQRTLIELMRRILELSESRFGKISVLEKRLIFEYQADLEVFRSLSRKLTAESEREDELLKEWADRQRAIVQRLKGM
ncbi:MAG TPA: DUF2059 domain-containing protein [Noviherbaspirillum sp.]|nr:DUF2059 domain-containing protein [Noviherbaspirillum sp.]